VAICEPLSLPDRRWRRGPPGSAALKKSEAQIRKAAGHASEKQRLANGLPSFRKAAELVVSMAADRRPSAAADSYYELDSLIKRLGGAELSFDPARGMEVGANTSQAREVGLRRKWEARGRSPRASCTG